MTTRIELDAAKRKVAAAKVNRVKASFDYYSAEGEIYVFGEIGPESEDCVDASMVNRALKKIGNRPVTVYIDSPGGSVDTGVSIFNSLDSHKAGVTTVIASLAASIASVIFQAGKQRIAYSNSVLMVHMPHAITHGNAGELRRTADLLDRYGKRIIDIYAERSGQSPQQLTQMLEQETWLSGKEIVTAGFADTLRSSSKRIAASSRVATVKQSTAQQDVERLARFHARQNEVKQRDALRMRTLQLKYGNR
jgi:ATP-dependent Clp endopeptidase proteolytic subunit ClpP